MTKGAITVVGLGPGDFDRTSPTAKAVLDDHNVRVILRTVDHPAAHQLAERRQVETCDDLYEQIDSFDDLYEAIAGRVLAAAVEGDVVYGVPGSPLVGERSVRALRTMAATAGVAFEVILGESFIDAALGVLEVDPLTDGLRVLDGRDLPNPLLFDSPTIIGHLDLPVVLAEAAARIGQVLLEDTPVTLLSELGTAAEQRVDLELGALEAEMAGPRTSLYVPPAEAGVVGVIHTMRRLRASCPWDRDQTHHSIVGSLIEETHELAEALAALPIGAPKGEPDHGAYADVEEELGDVLLQVLFHTTMAEEAGAFGIDDVAETLRRKLVRRHPHVFGDGEASTPSEVRELWEEIKEDEKPRESQLDGIPPGMPGLERARKVQERAARVGFDWAGAGPVFAKVREEIEELEQAPAEAQTEELGDLLFAAVNLSRHLGVDAEVALRRATDKFSRRFRAMEATGTDLTALDLVELDRLWEEAKQGQSLGPSGPVVDSPVNKEGPWPPR